MYLVGNAPFPDFELIDSGEGYRLERWGTYTLARPDPQTIWKRSADEAEWQRANAIFRGDQWEMRGEMPEHWDMSFGDMKLRVRPMNFKHTGVFPEQAENWKWMEARLSGLTRPNVMNLFAYTGAASVWLTRRGAFVTHVDASRPAIGWAKDNQELNGLAPDSIRWMLEDAAVFAKKEAKRGAQYEGIVMDPPAFGHGPTGKVWKFNEHMPALIRDCVALLSPDARFLLINAYATNTSELALKNLLEDAIGDRGGTIEAGQLCLQQRNGRLLSTGIFARWSRSE
ncbi:MAG: class I SAM-dependent methyltransferase [Candidatus Yanofskybacteria bacterium]|nr:class I SAM-dependent methyltransferase [Candidatus Yanofskybacteria bacterium]